MELLISFIIAFFINFFAMAPPGMISLKLVSIRFEKTFKEAFVFALGVVFIEFFQTMATFHFSSFFAHFFDGNIYIKSAAVVLLIILSVVFFFAKPKTKINYPEQSLKVLTKKADFFKGAFLSLINVLKYPFWIFQGVYFINKGIIQNDIVSLSIYSLGAGLGSLLMYVVYIKVGNKILNKFQSLANNINLLLAGFFLFLAIVQLLMILK